MRCLCFARNVVIPAPHVDCPTAGMHTTTENPLYTSPVGAANFLGRLFVPSPCGEHIEDESDFPLPMASDSPRCAASLEDGAPSMSSDGQAEPENTLLKLACTPPGALDRTDAVRVDWPDAAAAPAPGLAYQLTDVSRQGSTLAFNGSPPGLTDSPLEPQQQPQQQGSSSQNPFQQQPFAAELNPPQQQPEQQQQQQLQQPIEEEQQPVEIEQEQSALATDAEPLPFYRTEQQQQQHQIQPCSNPQQEEQQLGKSEMQQEVTRPRQQQSATRKQSSNVKLEERASEDGGAAAAKQE